MKKILLTSVFIFLLKLIYAYTGEIISSFDTPGKFPTGATFDGKNIWIADRMDDKLYCIDQATGVVIRSVDAPAYWPAGLAWDGKYLWCVDIKGGIPLAENYNGKIYKIDPADGTILHTIQSPTSNPQGLTWDGTYLWCADNSSDELVQFDPADGTTIRTLEAPARDSRGLTWDGKYLWVSDRLSDMIYMVDPESGCVIVMTDSPGPVAYGLCYDGKNLWNIDYQDRKIYKLKVRDEENYKLFNERRGFLTFTHLTTNFGPGSVKTLDVHFALPEKRLTQMINDDIIYTPASTDIITDKWGQRTAHFHSENIMAGGKSEAQMRMDVTTWSIRYYIFPDKVGPLSAIPEDVKKTCLENNNKYQLDNPVIRNALNKAVGDEKNPYWIVRKIYNYLIENMYYEMAGGWNTAPTVLERGNGSCSEYTFVFISMCRAAGIPARYVGSVVVRGDDASMDDVFHRWAEVYLPNYGWVPVDPSGGDHDLPADQAGYFGALANRFCITTQSGGGSETMEWTYNCNEFYTTEPKTNVVVEYFGDWEPYFKK